MELIILFAIMAVAFWLLIVRPQRKRMLDHQRLLAQLEVGDEVLSSAGIYGTVRALHDDGTLELEVAEGIIITITKGAVAQRTEDEPDDDSGDD